MTYKIVADSSADLHTAWGGIPFESVPLTIRTGEREFVDDSSLELEQMLQHLEGYKGKSGSACPGVYDYVRAFGEAERIFCFTITSQLSGSNNSARLAKEDYESDHPERKVFVVDTLSTGPEMKLLVEHTEKLIGQGKSFEEICIELERYSRKTRLMFSLESLKNLANNGRVSPVVAKVAGVLGIRILGKASDEGTLETMDKVRGEKKAIPRIVQLMEKLGYAGGKVRIDHCQNPQAAAQLKGLLMEKFQMADIRIAKTMGLCSFYAERGGLLVGFETE